MPAKITSARGTYGLHIRMAHASHLRIANLGKFFFPAGDYIYIGSALGTGGLQARIRRHLLPQKKFHWHVDWLAADAATIGVWYAPCQQRLECLWAKVLDEIPQFTTPAPGFGASDCRAHGSACAAHLFFSDGQIETGEIGGKFAHRSSLSPQMVNYLGLPRDRPSSYLHLE